MKVSAAFALGIAKLPADVFDVLRDEACAAPSTLGSLWDTGDFTSRRSKFLLCFTCGFRLADFHRRVEGTGKLAAHTGEHTLVPLGKVANPAHTDEQALSGTVGNGATQLTLKRTLCPHWCKVANPALEREHNHLLVSLIVLSDPDVRDGLKASRESDGRQPPRRPGRYTNTGSSSTTASASHCLSDLVALCSWFRDGSWWTSVR